MKRVRLARRPLRDLEALEKSVNDWLTINADKTVHDIRFQALECNGVPNIVVSIVFESEEDKVEEDKVEEDKLEGNEAQNVEEQNAHNYL